VEVYTIGYEGRGLEEFVGTLLENRIEIIVDIRRLPVSHKPGFSKSRLSATLRDSGIDYVHLPTLGSPKSLRDALRATQDYDRLFSDYEACLAEEEDCLQELQQWGSERRICLLCAERQHNRCHRSVVSSILTDRAAVEVVHL